MADLLDDRLRGYGATWRETHDTEPAVSYAALDRPRPRPTWIALGAAAVALVCIGGGVLLAGGPERGSAKPSDAATSNVGPVDLEGTWRVTALTVGKAHPRLDLYRGEVQVEFRDGTVSGTDGCNEVGGSYTTDVDGAALAFEGLRTTLTGCVNAAPLLSNLARARTVEGDGDERYFRAANGLLIIALWRVPADGALPDYPGGRIWIPAANGENGYVDKALEARVTGSYIRTREEALDLVRRRHSWTYSGVRMSVYAADGVTRVGVQNFAGPGNGPREGSEVTPPTAP